MDHNKIGEPVINYDEDLKIISVPEIIEIKHQGLGQLFFDKMTQHKNRIAQYIADTGEEDTYASLLQRCIRTAIHLRMRNFNRNDVICLCTRNRRDSCVPFIAGQMNGVKVASLDPSFTVNDATYLIKLVNPKIFFVGHEAISLIEKCKELSGISAEIVVLESNDLNHDHTRFEDFIKKCEDENNFEPIRIENVFDTSVIFFSSGTTGLPKAICTHHYGLAGQAANMVYYNSISSTILSLTTLYWISAVDLLIASVLIGKARLICSTFNPRDLWQHIEKYKVNFIFIAPIQASELIKIGRPDKLDTTSLHAVITGGVHFSTTKINQFRDLLPGTFVSQCYGQTEHAGAITYFNVNNIEDRLKLLQNPESCGRPISGLEYKVIDPETELACGPNERGELRIRSRYSMKEYYHMDASSAFDGDAWLKTGDIVYFDDELFLYIIDRLKEMLKYKSWHVAPAVLEQVILTHPGVKGVAVIGLPHEEYGDLPMAVIQLRSDYEDKVTQEEIESFVASRVDDRYRLRGGVKFMRNIPTTPTGKYKRKELKQMVLNGTI